jgi:uncharacterized protein (TIGR02453 family)
MANLQQSFNFLVDLRLNNDRIWFNNNKDYYQSALGEFESFINEMIPVLKSFDASIDTNSAKECLFRIYKDVRFSANKDPYKTNFGAYIVKGGKKSPYAGYYIHFEPDSSFIGGGIYMPQPDVLLKLRTHVLNHSAKFKKIIYSDKFVSAFGTLMDEKLKTPPKGFPKDHPDIALTFYKSYAIGNNISNEMWFESNLVNKFAEIFKIQFDFNEFLNNALK